MVALHICITPIPSQKLVFALFISLFHLWHMESDICFPKKQADQFPLTFGPSQITSGPENSVAFLCKINRCLPLCIIKCQVAFLDAAADCVEWQWYSRAHVAISIMVAWRCLKTIPPEGSMVTCIHYITLHYIIVIWQTLLSERRNWSV